MQQVVRDTEKFVTMALVTLCLIILLAGCERNAYEQTNENSSNVEIHLSTSDAAMYMRPFELGSIVSGAVSLENRLFISGINGDEPLLGVVEFAVSDNGDIELSETNRIENVDGFRILGITTGGDGYFYVLLGNPNPTLFSNQISDGQLIVQKYTSSGEFLDQMEIQNWSHRSVNGLGVGEDGVIVIHGSTYASFLHWNQEKHYTKNFSDGIVLLAITQSGGNFVAEVHNALRRNTSYYLVDGYGTFSLLDAASINDYEIFPEGFNYIESLGLYFTSANLTEQIIRSVSQSELGINSLGVVTQSQGFFDGHIVNDGFRFIALCLNTGNREKLHHWNYSLAMNDIRSCLSVSRIHENILAYTIRNQEFLFFANIG